MPTHIAVHQSGRDNEMIQTKQPPRNPGRFKALKPKTAVLAQVFEYTECDYNRVRKHSSNGRLSPVQFEHNYHQYSEVKTV